jgi:hypothetical protein
MKNVNRKVLLTLLGVVVTIPFLFTAAVVSGQVVALAGSVRADELCVALVVVSVALRIVEGHLALRGKLVSVDRSSEPRANADQSRISPGY